MAGTLFVVATPIGNLEDLTFRALRTLREVQLIAAEDTRRTAKLLAHYEIRCPLVSLREHNEARETPRLLDKLGAGQDIALVSDAGTPGISDPGARLVRAAHERQIRVVPIPGPSAVAAALSASGVSADEFVFMGFPPSSGTDRQQWLDRLAAEPRTVVFFESPHRIRRTLADVGLLSGIRPIMVARELTKINEQLVMSPINVLPERGEFTIVLGQAPSNQGITDLTEEQARTAQALVGYLTQYLSYDENTACRMTAAALGVTPSQVKKLVKRARYASRAAERDAET